MSTIGERLAHSMWPGVPLIPTMATGFSDDRQTRNAGIPSYDVSGIWMDGDENRAHGRDERVGVQAFDESVEFTYRLMKAMGRVQIAASTLILPASRPPIFRSAARFRPRFPAQG